LTATNTDTSDDNFPALRRHLDETPEERATRLYNILQMNPHKASVHAPSHLLTLLYEQKISLAKACEWLANYAAGRVDPLLDLDKIKDLDPALGQLVPKFIVYLGVSPYTTEDKRLEVCNIGWWAARLQSQERFEFTRDGNTYSAFVRSIERVPWGGKA
jgi:hypothetical protein